MRSIAAITCLGLLTACGSTDPFVPADDQLRAEVRADKERLAQANTRINDYDRVLLDLDKWIDKYLEAYRNSGNRRADDLRATLDKLIRAKCAEHFTKLINSAINQEFPRNQAIALGALGFSGKPEALDPLLNGLLSKNDEVVSNAQFGLGMLKHKKTPPRSLQAVFQNTVFDADLRAGAAWSLYRIQTELGDMSAVIEVWREVLEQPIDTYDGGTLVSALRGLGLAREPELAPIAERFVSHPDAKVRQTCCITLGRLGNRAAHTSLFTLISTIEPNQNVRLAARTALRALAGQEDRGWDIDEWKKVFEDG